MPLTKETFVGRAQELAALQRALAGRPALVIVEGPGGIGKTSLVDRFVAGLRTWRASGDESEASVPFALADQLARRTSGDMLLGETDHVKVGLRLLAMLDEERRPDVLVVDDVHWADEASLRAFLFATRRLVAEPLLVVLVTRNAALLPEGLRRIARTHVALQPMSADEVAAMAAAVDRPLTQTDARRLSEHTGGLPLHVRTLLDELPSAGRLGSVLPVPRSYGAVMNARLRACSPEGRQLVEASAALGVRSPLRMVAELADVERPLEAFDDGVDAGLLARRDDEEDGVVEFTHPLARAAVYHGLPVARRAALHLRAATLVGDEATALRHRVAAAPTADPVLAADVEAFARRELQRGAWASAAASLLAAGRLSEARLDQERLALDAIDALMNSGDGVGARRVAAALPPHESEPLAAQREAALAYLAMFSNNVDEAEARLDRAWQMGPTGHLAATIALRRSFVAGVRLRSREFVEWARRALALAPEDVVIRALATVQLAAGMSLEGRRSEAHALLDAEMASGRSAGFALGTLKGELLFDEDELEAARTILEAAASESRDTGSLVIAAHALAVLAKVEFAAGRWDAAVVSAERASALAVESDLPWMLALTHWTGTHVPLARGDAPATLPPRIGTFERMIEVEACAHAEAAAAAGSPQGVLAALQPLLDGPTGSWRWQPMYAEALVDLDRLDEADAFLDENAGRWSRSVEARLSRARGRLEAARQRPQAAESAFALALSGLQHMPYELARTELAYGQFLRRRRRRREAIEHLSAAQRRLSALGARPALARCERELAAAGQTSAPAPAPDGLTPQERAVARLVARGCSNRTVADELLLSVRTVEAHLTRIYGKLGINSRAELAATYAEGRDDAGITDAKRR